MANLIAFSDSLYSLKKIYKLLVVILAVILNIYILVLYTFSGNYKKDFIDKYGRLHLLHACKLYMGKGDASALLIVYTVWKKHDI